MEAVLVRKSGEEVGEEDEMVVSADLVRKKSIHKNQSIKPHFQQYTNTSDDSTSTTTIESNSEGSGNLGSRIETFVSSGPDEVGTKRISAYEYEQDYQALKSKSHEVHKVDVHLGSDRKGVYFNANQGTEPTNGHSTIGQEAIPLSSAGPSFGGEEEPEEWENMIFSAKALLKPVQQYKNETVENSILHTTVLKPSINGSEIKKNASEQAVVTSEQVEEYDVEKVLVQQHHKHGTIDNPVVNPEGITIILKPSTNGSEIRKEPPAVKSENSDIPESVEEFDVEKVPVQHDNHEISGNPVVSTEGMITIPKPSTNGSVTKQDAPVLEEPVIGPEPVEEYDVEKVLEKQKTHDLFCPNCKSCITKRVILRKRKRKLDVITPTAEEDAPDPEIIDTPPERDVVEEPVAPSASIERDDNAERDVFRCLSCFSIFIPSGNGFKFWKFGKQRKDQITQRSGDTPATVADPDMFTDEVERGTLDAVTTPQSDQQVIKGVRPEVLSQLHGTADQKPVPGLTTPISISNPSLPTDRVNEEKPTYPTVDINLTIPITVTKPPLPTDRIEEERLAYPADGNGVTMTSPIRKPSSHTTDCEEENKPAYPTDRIEEERLAYPADGNGVPMTSPIRKHSFNTTDCVEENKPAYPTDIADPTMPIPIRKPSLPTDRVEQEEPDCPSDDIDTEASPLIPAKREIREVQKLATNVGAGDTIRSEVAISIPDERGMGSTTRPLNAPEELTQPLLPPDLSIGSAGVTIEDETGSVAGVDVINAIVYGGLMELIASLSVVTSAVGADAATMKILALGAANVFGGLFVLAHNLRLLKRETSIAHYEAQLGKRGHFALHATVAVISYIIFGLMPPIVYAFSFRSSDNRDYKLAVLCASAVFCIIVLSLAKAYVRSPAPYIKTLSYYFTLGVLVCGVSYLVGDLLEILLEKLDWFESSSSVSMLVPKVGGSWAS